MGERRQRNEVEGREGMEKTQGEKLYENKMYIRICWALKLLFSPKTRNKH